MCLQGQPEAVAHHRVLEVGREQRADPLEPVDDGVAVDAEAGGGVAEAAVRPTQRGAGGAMPLLAAAAERGMTVMASGSLLQARVIGRLPAALRELLGGPTDAQSALQFTRSAPGLATALVGMSRVDHVEENLALVARPPLDPDGFAALFR